jgi:NAD(P)-dependent dehydrogenase (short-subunit alcohol dehydrogenase family)
MAILITGGVGYIGSHSCVELLRSGEDVVVLDNLSNGNPEALRRVEKITGKKVASIVADVRDLGFLRSVFAQHPIEAVIHFAGLKAVGESQDKPLLYYQNNVVGTINLLDAMRDANVRALVLSSSATVYGNPQGLPLTEDHPLGAINPYGRTKLMIEQIIADAFARIARLPAPDTLAVEASRADGYRMRARLHVLGSRYDALLYCNAANAVFTWMPRALGIPVALNVDGLERNRTKWNRMGQAWYRMSEWLATWMPNTGSAGRTLPRAGRICSKRLRMCWRNGKCASRKRGWTAARSPFRTPPHPRPRSLTPATWRR